MCHRIQVPLLIKNGFASIILFKTFEKTILLQQTAGYSTYVVLYYRPLAVTAERPCQRDPVRLFFASFSTSVLQEQGLWLPSSVNWFQPCTFIGITLVCGKSPQYATPGPMLRHHSAPSLSSDRLKSNQTRC